MSGTSTGIWPSAIGAINAQAQVRASLEAGLRRMYTGNRVNSAADDPAGIAVIVDVKHRIAAARAALQNNTRVVGELAGVDSAQYSMLRTLLDLRDAVQRSIGEKDPDRQQALLDEVSALVEAYDHFARNTRLGSTAALAGDARIAINQDADVLLDPAETHVRRASPDQALLVAFRPGGAAEQAYVNEVYAAPAIDSEVRISTAHGSAVVTISAGTGLAAAAAAVDSAVAGIGATAKENGGRMLIATDAYGQGESVRVETLSGDDLFGASVVEDAAGVDGQINVNGRSFALKGDLSLAYSDVTFSATLVFRPDRVALDAATGAAPASASVQVKTSGGVILHYGSGTSSLDRARVGFSDLTAEARGLDGLTRTGDPNYFLDDPDAAIAAIMDAYDKLRADHAELGTLVKYDLSLMSERLQGMLESLYDQQSALLDTDQAYEAARLAKLQFMQDAGLSAMSMEIASRQSILRLLSAQAS